MVFEICRDIEMVELVILNITSILITLTKNS